MIVPGDSYCSSVAFGPSANAAPSNSFEGLAALEGSLEGTYPDSTSDAGHGCVDIVRSTLGPGG